jgi:hypothetical protein
MNSMQQQSLIVLRFRDINVNKNETIRKHRLIINDAGYCWWGWLFREYERNPHAEIVRRHSELSGGDRALPYTIGLYDTGQGRIYEAKCDQVRTWPGVGFSPEVDFTPDYYRDRRAPAWFRLLEITDSSPDLVVGRICAEMPSAVSSCYTDLQGKSVTKLEDLRRQEVTLWMLE